MLMAHPYGGGYPPPPPPFADPYMNMPYNNIYGPPPPPHMRGGPQMRGPPPNYYQRPQDIMSEADAILNNINEEEEWKTDKQKAKEKGEFIEGEVINFNPEHSQQERGSRPLKNAAAYPSDLNMDEEVESSSNEDVEDSVFQGRMPGQPVNRNNSNNSQSQAQGNNPKSTTPQNNNNKMEEDPRAQHVILDDYDSYMNDFFDFPIQQGMGREGMPPPSRGGPAVYTNEEEELIAAMGGRQRMPPPPVVGGGPQPRQVNDINGMGNGQQRTTQEFAGLGTLTNNKGRDRGIGSGDPQQLNYNPEQNFNPQQAQSGGIMPPPLPQGMPMMPPPNQAAASLREEGFLGDSTLKEISLDYSGKSAFVLLYHMISCVQ